MSIPARPSHPSPSLRSLQLVPPCFMSPHPSPPLSTVLLAGEMWIKQKSDHAPLWRLPSHSEPKSKQGTPYLSKPFPITLPIAGFLNSLGCLQPQDLCTCCLFGLDSYMGSLPPLLQVLAHMLAFSEHPFKTFTLFPPRFSLSPSDVGCLHPH